MFESLFTEFQNSNLFRLLYFLLMICDYNAEEKCQRVKKSSAQTLVSKALQSKKYQILTVNQLLQFLNQREIIQCIHYLQAGLSYSKLVKLYFILFQVTARYGEKQEIYNFLPQFQFLQRLNKAIPVNCPKAQVVTGTKIAKFLDSYKIGHCPKIQLNSLISEYQEFRLLQNSKQPFVTQSCKLIQQFIYYHLNQLITEVEYTNWKYICDEDFVKFYQHYCEICTICKRVSYIKCSLFNWPVFTVPPAIRACIQDKNCELNLRKSESAEINQETKVNEAIRIPIFNVKKKLKAMNILINKMGEKL